MVVSGSIPVVVTDDAIATTVFVVIGCCCYSCCHKGWWCNLHNENRDKTIASTFALLLALFICYSWLASIFNLCVCYCWFLLCMCVPTGDARKKLESNWNRFFLPKKPTYLLTEIKIHLCQLAKMYCWKLKLQFCNGKN